VGRRGDGMGVERGYGTFDTSICVVK